MSMANNESNWEKWNPRFIYIRDRRHAFCPVCGNPILWEGQIEEALAVSREPKFHCGYCKSRLKFDRDRHQWLYQDASKINKDGAMMKSKEDMNRKYADPDPYGVKTDPADKVRKEIILGAMNDHIVACRDGQRFRRALDIGCGEGWITQDIPADEIVGYDPSDIALSRVPDGIIVFDDPKNITGKFDCILAAGILVNEYGPGAILDLISEFAEGFVLTCQTNVTEAASIQRFEARQTYIEEFPYREHKQRLRIFDFSDTPKESGEITEDQQMESPEGISTQEESPGTSEPEKEEVDAPEPVPSGPETDSPASPAPADEINEPEEEESEEVEDDSEEDDSEEEEDSGPHLPGDAKPETTPANF